ncbi:uncharacterized protein L969DRAFT_101588 [Mixia osmundae IAM 14324]|uniref:WSC domain-containing protein n=1 Tax=Mixia osmundae (strain CBS 9802 / IAM 14324 / JCM 22182 / KY 12970) TaxID=764103 RepID=G7DY20_MIXOS|nr:uncharacterized protein L969DRAFT_101588 [Mixia osmundae IAM 14324]KEI41381.1 hypothetical protein L969DRAFT_101588 [Mixia osmundae IAM 14324]GAA95480.1 hypothetical protein E5Q_02134 [Mixia osmundae IAM 14324]
MPKKADRDPAPPSPRNDGMASNQTAQNASTSPASSSSSAQDVSVERDPYNINSQAYVGCYTLGLSDLSAVSSNTSNVAWQACADHCQNQHYGYFGVSISACGCLGFPDADDAVAISRCNADCPGMTSDPCGSSDKLFNIAASDYKGRKPKTSATSAIAAPTSTFLAVPTIVSPTPTALEPVTPLPTSIQAGTDQTSPTHISSSILIVAILVPLVLFAMLLTFVARKVSRSRSRRSHARLRPSSPTSTMRSSMTDVFAAGDMAQTSFPKRHNHLSRLSSSPPSYAERAPQQQSYLAFLHAQLAMSRVSSSSIYSESTGRTRSSFQPNTPESDAQNPFADSQVSRPDMVHL